MIVVVGRPALGAAAAGGQDRPMGPGALIALAAAAAGASAKLLGAVGDDARADALAVALGRAGVGHAALLRLAGAVTLIGWGGLDGIDGGGGAFALVLVAVAAGLWGLYSLAARALADVPTAAIGVFFAAAGLISAALHLALEPTIVPTLEQWVAVAALGTLPMGLALYFWDFGVKRGDLQALSAFSYFEPFIGAVLVALLGQGTLGWNVAGGGALIVGGAVLASRGMWMAGTTVVSARQG